MKFIILFFIIAFLTKIFNIPKTTQRMLKKYSAQIEAARNALLSRFKNIPTPRLIAAVIWVESGGDPTVVGKIGERGLMQLTQGAVDEINRRLGTVLQWELMFSPVHNISAGTAYLSLQYERAGNWPDAVRAYNAGISGMKRGLAFDYLEKIKKAGGL